MSVDRPRGSGTGPPNTHFGRCRSRLERVVEEASKEQSSWPAKVRAAIGAAVELAGTDLDLGRTLTEAAGRHPEDEEFASMVDRLAAWLERGAPGRNPRLPDAPTVVRRIARQVNLELEEGRDPASGSLGPDLVFLALMPYLGFAEARRWAQPTATR
jgi:hypothetical protein